MCSERTQPDVYRGGEFDMNAVFADANDANPSLPACVEYRQYTRGVWRPTASPWTTSNQGARRTCATPDALPAEPGFHRRPFHFVEDGQAATHQLNPFHVDLNYGHRDAFAREPLRHVSGEAALRGGVRRQNPTGIHRVGRQLRRVDVDRGQLTDVCNGGTVGLFPESVTVTVRGGSATFDVSLPVG